MPFARIVPSTAKLPASGFTGASNAKPLMPRPGSRISRSLALPFGSPSSETEKVFTVVLAPSGIVMR